MGTFTAKDGAKLYYKDWGSGRPVVFSHGWPLSADAWDSQMMFLSMHGYRVIAHDRRGHGRSEQTDGGNDIDTYADDLSALIEMLDLKGATLIGHSTGGGEVARYIGRHGNSRVAKAVLIASIPPWLLKSPDNPNGVPIEVFDGLRQGVLGERSSFYKTLAVPFFGYNKPDAKPSQGVIDAFWLQSMTGGVKGHYECVKALSESNFTEDLKKFYVPTLVLHGDADQIVPIDLSSKLSVNLISNAKLKIIPGAPHGMCVTHADTINADLLAFLSA